MLVVYGHVKDSKYTSLHQPSPVTIQDIMHYVVLCARLHHVTIQDMYSVVLCARLHHVKINQ